MPAVVADCAPADSLVLTALPADHLPSTAPGGDAHATPVSLRRLQTYLLTACCLLPWLQTTFLVQRPVGMRMLVQALATEKPTPSCMVCGTAQLQLQINTASTTLAQFINKVRCAYQLHII